VAVLKLTQQNAVFIIPGFWKKKVAGAYFSKHCLLYHSSKSKSFHVISVSKRLIFIFLMLTPAKSSQMERLRLSIGGFASYGEAVYQSENAF